MAGVTGEHRVIYFNVPDDHGTELTDSVLHWNVKRMMLGIVCGLIGGTVMLLVTMAFTKPGEPSIWWLHLAASAVYGGDAMAYDAPSSVIVTGLLLHAMMSGLIGLIFGKLTRRNGLFPLFCYALVVGYLCWLGSYMFAQDVLNFDALWAVNRFVRFAIFFPFTITTAMSLGVLGRILKV